MLSMIKKNDDKFFLPAEYINEMMYFYDISHKI